jgi:hypothetical protein
MMERVSHDSLQRCLNSFSMSMAHTEKVTARGNESMIMAARLMTLALHEDDRRENAWRGSVHTLHTALMPQLPPIVTSAFALSADVLAHSLSRAEPAVPDAWAFAEEAALEAALSALDTDIAVTAPVAASVSAVAHVSVAEVAYAPVADEAAYTPADVVTAPPEAVPLPVETVVAETAHSTEIAARTAQETPTRVGRRGLSLLKNSSAETEDAAAAHVSETSVHTEEMARAESVALPVRGGESCRKFFATLPWQQALSASDAVAASTVERIRIEPGHAVGAQAVEARYNPILAATAHALAYAASSTHANPSPASSAIMTPAALFSEKCAPFFRRVPWQGSTRA